MRVLLKLYANVNLGDDLFLKILLDRYPNVDFILPASLEYLNIFKEYKNLQIVEDNYEFNYGIIKRSINYIKRNYFLNNYIKQIESKFSKNFDSYNYNAFISIGGSIFMQRKKMPIYSSIIYYKIAQQRCENTFFLGCNFGPYNDLKFLEEYKTIFKKATDVSFREDVSYNLFKNLDNVRVNPDIVFGLNFNKSETKPKSVGFSVVSPRNAIDKDSYINKYAELVEYYQNKEYDVYFYSFCEAQGDGNTIDLIKEKLNNKDRINIVTYNGRIEEFLKIYSSMEQMYCGRFHAMILSMIFDQKIFPIIYSDKMTNVLNDIAYEGKIIEIENFKDLIPNKVFSSIKNNNYNINELKLNAVKHFAKTDTIFRKDQ